MPPVFWQSCYLVLFKRNHAHFHTQFYNRSHKWLPLSHFVQLLWLLLSYIMCAVYIVMQEILLTYTFKSNKLPSIYYLSRQAENSVKLCLKESWFEKTQEACGSMGIYMYICWFVYNFFVKKFVILNNFTIYKEQEKLLAKIFTFDCLLQSTLFLNPQSTLVDFVP